MRLVRYPSRHRQSACVATIGNFDGVHLGHQSILRLLRRHALRLGVPTVVVTFEPQPQEYFQREQNPARLTAFREKFTTLRTLGVDLLVCLRFDCALASLAAEDFVEKVLLRDLGVRYLVVGKDFRFGKGRRGTFSMLSDMAKEYGFEVEGAPTFELDGERVSSTRVRDALKFGDIEKARRLLGRYYSIGGRVVHGEKRGQTLGFPTANLFLRRLAGPLEGIFAARIRGLAADPLSGAAYIGQRPTVDGRRRLLEVFIFEYDEDCYGRHIEVEFIQKIRDDRKFDSLEAMRRQIGADAEDARRILAEAKLYN